MFAGFHIGAFQSDDHRDFEIQLFGRFDNPVSHEVATDNSAENIDESGFDVLVGDENPEGIFDRFYSERPRGEAYGEHSGLGLSIAKQIVEAHKGSIYAENMRDADGKVTGARFTVELPAF